VVCRPTGASGFDQELYLNFTIIPYLDVPDTTGDYLWSKFQPIFGRVHMVYQYLPVFRKYYTMMFDKLFADGLLRWEMRTSLDPVYDETGHFYSQEETMLVILEELEAWKRKDPLKREAFSFAIVMQGLRSASVEEVSAALLSAYELRDVFPDVIVGFDLVGQEDPVSTLIAAAAADVRRR
jgi:adenosine deaminase CECR1